MKISENDVLCLARVHEGESQAVAEFELSRLHALALIEYCGQAVSLTARGRQILSAATVEGARQQDAAWSCYWTFDRR